MNQELAFNAYVFLPNVLNLVENRMEVDYSEQIGASRDEVAALHNKILTPQPNTMLTFIEGLTEHERSLLLGCATLCLSVMDDDELAALMGLPRAECDAVLQFVSAVDDHA